MNGAYTVALDPATLPSGTTPRSDRDGGDPALTTLSISGASILDADFGVLDNDPPIPITGPPSAASACGAEVVVDPTGSLTDPNGDALAIVPGSVVAPAGVTTQVRPDGMITITAPAGVSSTYTLTWTVTDGRGGTAPVTFTLTTTCFTPNQGAQCVSRLPIITWSLTSPAGPVDRSGHDLLVRRHGHLSDGHRGSAGTGPREFPNEPWAGRSVDVTFGTPDGALVGPFDVPNLCATLPATGTDHTKSSPSEPCCSPPAPPCWARPAAVAPLVGPTREQSAHRRRTLITPSPTGRVVGYEWRMENEPAGGIDHRLTTRQMAEFVANGVIRFDAIVPADINERAIEEMRQLNAERMSPTGMKPPHTGTPLDECYPPPSAIGEYLRLPEVVGIIESFVGRNPRFDHDWTHHITPPATYVQPLHVDAITDSADLAFDVQLFWYPHDVEPGEGGTRYLPGSISDAYAPPASIATSTSPARSSSPVPPARSSSSTTGSGTPGQPNPSGTDRWMHKVRLNPIVPQVRLWNTADLDELQNPPSDHVFARMLPDSVAQIFRTWHPWMSVTDYRNEQVQRALLWRYLTGDDHYDVDRYLTRLEGHAGGAGVKPTAADPLSLGKWIVARFADRRLGVPRRDRWRGPCAARGP